MIANDFTIPQYVKFDEDATDRHARITVEPFERGYGTTVGNALRRVLLSSLEGSAVTAIRIDGVSHEFSAIPGVHEDVTNVVLNLKKCEIRLNRDEPLIFSFSHKGQGPVTAGAIFKDQDVDVFNPDHPILTATSKTTEINMEMKVARGRGYVTAEHFELEHAPLGTIYLDAIFSPVTKVNFDVEDARVGQTTDFDRLILDIWTDGSITPEKALEEASQLLVDHLRIFVKQDRIEDAEGGAGGIDDPELIRLLSRSIDEFELSVRAANCLKAANIHTIGALAAREEKEMLRFHNFGKQSLNDIKALLEGMNLTFGMKAAAAFATSAPLPDDDEEVTDEEAVNEDDVAEENNGGDDEE